MMSRKYLLRICITMLVALITYSQQAEAQRMGHAASGRAAGGNRMGGGGGGTRQMNTPSHNTNNRMGSGGGGTQRSINGGSHKSPDRSIQHNNNDRINTNNSGNRNSGNRNSNNKITDNSRNISGSGNKINTGDVNINIDNSKHFNQINTRNTVVRPMPRAYYPRPPYRYGGRAYFCFHPYVYHPYRPFYWGPVWHPWGFFVATLAVTAIVVSVENAQYHYDQGVWYSQSSGGYTVVQAPVGGTVTTIPSGNQPVVVNNVTNYYYGGAYYEKSSDGKYKVVAPPAGAVVDNLPEGGEEVRIGDQTYVKIGETYYQPVEVDGKDKYEVAQIEDEDKK